MKMLTQPEARVEPCRSCGNRPVEWTPMTLPDGREIGRPPECPECVDARRAEDERREREEEAERRLRERTEREARIHDLLHAAGVNPWAHGASTLGSWKPDGSPAPLDATRALLADVRGAEKYDPVRGLYLHGPTGTGKTHLAAALIRELLVDGWSPGAVCMDHAAALITEIQDCYGSDRSVLAVKAKRVDARLWILDDLGTERPSDDVVRILTEILNQREGRATMVTSNLAPQTLEDRHAELGRVVSRLGPRYFRVVKVDGRDHRFDSDAA